MITSGLEDRVWSKKPLQSLSDTELVQRAQILASETDGRSQAVGELYDRYHEDIFRYIWARVSNLQLAEDLTGDVFIRMVINLPKYRPSGAPFATWLYRIARNLVVDHHRKAANRYEVLPIESADYLSENDQSIPDVVEDQIFIEQAKNAIVTLKPASQDVVILRFLVGLPLQDVADILGKSVGSIKVTQHRALKELRVILDGASGEES